MPPELTQQEKDEISAFNQAIGLEEPPAGDEPPANDDQSPAAQGDDAPAGDAADAPQGEADDSAAKGADAGDEPPADPPAGEGEAPPAGDEPPAGVTPPAADDEAEKLRKANAELQRQLEELKAKPKTEATPPAAATETPPPEPEEAKFEYSNDQKEAIEELEKEWPGLKKAMDAREAFLTFQFQQTQEKAMREFATQLQNYLAPLVGTHVQSAQEKHLAAVKSAVPDYDEVVDLLPEWIGKKPGMLKEVYSKAYESGTTEEVIELFKAFKQDTGRVQPQEQSPNPNAAAAAPAAPPKKVEPPAEKVSALTAVKGGGRSNPKPAAGPKDLTEEEAFNLAIGAK